MGEALAGGSVSPRAGTGDRRPVLGAWIVDGAPAGMGIRADGPITGNTARFVPHIIEE